MQTTCVRWLLLARFGPDELEAVILSLLVRYSTGTHERQRIRLGPDTYRGGLGGELRSETRVGSFRRRHLGVRRVGGTHRGSPLINPLFVHRLFVHRVFIPWFHRLLLFRRVPVDDRIWPQKNETRSLVKNHVENIDDEQCGQNPNQVIQPSPDRAHGIPHKNTYRQLPRS